MTVTITNLTVPFWRQGKRRPKDLTSILHCVSNRVRVANTVLRSELSQARVGLSPFWGARHCL